MLKIIDLSSHNGSINFSEVAKVVDGVLLRLGYRGYSNSGKLVQDTNFQYNFHQCKKYNIPVGVYWFTTAISKEETKEEVAFIKSMLGSDTVNFPIYIDSEYSNNNHNGRSDGLNRTNRTNLIVNLCDELEKSGFKAGVYASDSWFGYNLDLNRLKTYSLWVARYSTTPPKYVTNYDGWQYTSSGKIAGISGNVDVSQFCDDLHKGVKELTETEVREIVKEMLSNTDIVSGALRNEWEKAIELKITDGSNPKSYATREQVGAMIVRSVDKVVDKLTNNK